MSWRSGNVDDDYDDDDNDDDFLPLSEEFLGRAHVFLYPKWWFAVYYRQLGNYFITIVICKTVKEGFFYCWEKILVVVGSILPNTRMNLFEVNLIDTRLEFWALSEISGGGLQKIEIIYIQQRVRIYIKLICYTCDENKNLLLVTLCSI